MMNNLVIGRIFGLSLRILGIDVDGHNWKKFYVYKSILKLWFPTCLFVIHIDIFITNTVPLAAGHFSFLTWAKFLLPLILCHTAVLVMWLIILSREDQIKSLIENLNHDLKIINYDDGGIKIPIGNVATLCILLFSIVYCILLVYLSYFNKFCHLRYMVYYSNMDLDSVFIAFLFACKRLLICFLHPIATGHFMVLYCSICYHVSRILRCYRKQLNLLTDSIICTDDSTEDIFKAFLSITDSVKYIDSIFSSPSFLFLVTCSTILFYQFFYVLLQDKVGTAEEVFDQSVAALTASGFIFALIAAGSQVGLELQENNYYSRCFLESHPLNDSSSKIHISIVENVERIANRPLLVLSAYKSIYFTRGILITIFGSILSFALLIHTWQ